MSTREKSQGDVGRRDFLKLFGAAGAAASTLPLGGSASADEIMAATARYKTSSRDRRHRTSCWRLWL